MGVDGKGLGLLLESGQVRKVLASYVGREPALRGAVPGRELEVEFNPQGTLAERLRAGGAGIPAFYTATGVGTVIAEGKPHADFDGRTYLQERGIVADIASGARLPGGPGREPALPAVGAQLQPAGRHGRPDTIAEAEEIVGRGELDPDQVHTPGVFVQTVVPAGPHQGHRAGGQPRPPTVGSSRREPVMTTPPPARGLEPRRRWRRSPPRN